MALAEIAYAPNAFKLLNGVFCLYKEAKFSQRIVKSSLASMLMKDLNAMETRQQKELVDIEGTLRQNNLTVVTKKSYADHPLVLGPRYQEKDFSVYWAHYPGLWSSGVMVGGIGSKGIALAHKLGEANFLRVYELDCVLGRATQNNMTDGRTVEKTTFRHVSRERLDRVLANVQTVHRTQMFQTAGVDMHSQDGYELAAAGAFRPVSRRTPPVLYGLNCVRFASPQFTIRLQVINENHEFIGQLVSKLGLSLRSVASIDKIRCTRFGRFNLDHALLHKHWTLDHVLANIIDCKSLTEDDLLEPESWNLYSTSANK